MPLPFLYQLQNASFASLAATDFQVAVVDMDDAGLTAGQVASLEARGKGLLTYLSIGEAEDYRAYWQPGWTAAKPAWLLGENPDWPGNYAVKFWDPAWQKLVHARVDAAIALGYQGIYLDIVDAYETAQVRKAYPGTAAELRQAMIDFVTELSAYAKAESPGSWWCRRTRSGCSRLTRTTRASRTPPTSRRSTGSGSRTSGTTATARRTGPRATSSSSGSPVDAGKFVLATSYPTQDARQEAFVSSAIAAGLVPFVARPRPDRADRPHRRTIAARLAGQDVNFPDFSGGGGTGGGVGQLELRIAENHASVIAASAASLPDAISGGADAALFALDASGLHFRQAPDFEAPRDAGHDNVYDLVATRSRPAGRDHRHGDRRRGEAAKLSDGADAHARHARARHGLAGRDGNDVIRGLGGDDSLYGAAATT